MLSFQIVNNAKAIRIYCDDEGIDRLVAALLRLRGSPDHIHLLGPSAGGRALSDKCPFGEEAVSEVIITSGGDPKPDVG